MKQLERPLYGHPFGVRSEWRRNIINQGPEFLAGSLPIIWKLALTYVVPFLVASYGSFAAFRTAD